MLKLNIFNQRLSYFSDSEVVADSKGYLTFTLETSEDWAGYVGKTVQFTRDGVTYNVTNVSDGVEYAVPWEVLKGAGIMYVNAFAVKETGKRATTNQIQVEITESGLNEDSLDPSDPTPDIFQQYVEQVQENADKAQQAAKDAQQYTNECRDYKNKTQQLYQQTESIKNDITSLNSQVQQAAQSAFQYAKSAEASALAASQSETNAARSESESKEVLNTVKQIQTEVNNKSETITQQVNEAKLSADKAEANQQIVTETKEDIDAIYADIQNKEQNIITINNDINSKKSIIDTQYNEIQQIYEGIIRGTKYIEFSEDSDWVQQEDEYILDIGWDGSAILNIQVLRDGKYFITNFVDVVLNDGNLQIHSISPFSGRIALYALQVEEVMTSGSN